MIFANGGSQYTDQPGSAGRVRLEAYTVSFSGTPETQGPPISQFNSFIPTAPPPSIQVTSINGTAITENPSGFPDITTNLDQPVPVVITGHQVALGTVPTVTILGDSVDQPSVPCPGGMARTARGARRAPGRTKATSKNTTGRTKGTGEDERGSPFHPLLQSISPKLFPVLSVVRFLEATGVG